jgi:fluoroacetyl-CoA thioesterase
MPDITLDAKHIGATAERSLVVRDEDTAAHWGSGQLVVFATPYMIALMEGAAVDAVEPRLPEGYQTVGSLVNVRHLAATPVGRRVTARAVLTAIDGRKLTFRVEAHDNVGPIGEGEHERYIIDVARFMAKAAAR